MLKKLLLLHAAVEMIVGLLLLWDPSLVGFADGSHPETRHLAKLYGIVAFIFGVISYQLWRNFESNDMFRKIMLSIMAFHLMIGFYLFGLFRQGVLPVPAAAAYHLVMAVALGWFYMQEAAGKRDE